MNSINFLSLLVVVASLVDSVFSQYIQTYLRDGGHGTGRYDPNQLLNGFFPAWAIVMLSIAGVFLLISIVSFTLYKFGCSTKGNFKKLPLRAV